MNTLPIEAINQIATYSVTVNAQGTDYRFLTKYGVQYSVSFLEDDSLLNRESYQLIIANVNHVRTPRDVGVRDTILVIVEHFFQVNNTTLLYICETGDSKQSMRNRLFQDWFSHFQNSAFYTFLSSSVVDSEGIVNYAALIIRNDNPELLQIVTEFTQTIQFLSEKP